MRIRSTRPAGARGTSAVVVMIAAASACVLMRSISVAVAPGWTSTATAPARKIAGNATMSSGPFGSTTMTRSPGATPSAMSACANRAA